MSGEAAQTKKRNPGSIARWAGFAFLLLAVLAIVLGPSAGQDQLQVWPALLIGFGLIVVGYLQKIAAK